MYIYAVAQVLSSASCDYAAPIWCQYKKGNINDIEKIQKRATKLIIPLKKKLFLNLCLVPTLIKYGRLRGDMIEVFEILNGYYDINVAPHLMIRSYIRTLNF